MATYRAQIQVEVNQVLTANVMHWRDDTVGTNPDREDELNEFLTSSIPGSHFGAVWKNAFSEEAKITCAKITKVDPAPVGAQRVFFDELQGTVLGDSAPSQLVYVTRLYSALATRRGRGRHFWSGIPEAHLDGGNYEPTAYAGVMQQFLEAFNGLAASPDGSTWVPRVYSATDDVYRDVVAGVSDPIPRNQRDRTTSLCGS